MLTAKNILWFLLFIPGPGAYCQLNQISRIDGLSGSLINTIRASASEKIFVQTDKLFYTPGEQIWFKAYCLNSVSAKPIYTSKTLFLDIVNDRDSVISQSLLHNENGSTDGYIILPFLLNSGYYWLRAYTKDILQNNINNVFVSPVYIYGASGKDPDKLSNDLTTSPREIKEGVEFFPEGGSMIAGTNCVIAFRAWDKNGNPAEISGYVTDNRDSVTTKFQTSYPGLGKLNFEPWTNRKYTLHVKDKNNQEEVVYPLPSLNQSAAQLSLTDRHNDMLKVRVALGDNIYSNDFNTYLLCINKDSLCFAATGKGMYNVDIPQNAIPAGKATLLLFNDNNQIISERNIYIEKTNGISIEIKPDKDKYQGRDKVKLGVTVTGTDKLAESALVSVAVTNDRGLSRDLPKSSIMDLQFADIDFPAKTFSFSALKNYTPEEWDLVMLTQKYKYQQLWRGSDNLGKTANTRKENDLNLQKITGRVIDNHGEPVAGITVTLFSKQHLVIALPDITDTGGHFRFILPNIPEDSAIFSISASNPQGLKLNILIETPSVPVFKTPTSLKKKFILNEQQVLEISKNLRDDFTNAKGKELKEVKVINKLPEQRDAHVITSKDLLHGVNSIRNALLMIPGVQLKSGYLVIRGGMRPDMIGPGSEPLVILNEVPTPGEEGSAIEPSPVLGLLSAIPVENIDNIKVLTGPEASQYGLRGANGVIVVTTSTGKNKTAKKEETVEKNFYIKAYLKSFPFTYPDYSKKDKTNIPDHRTTLYWNGNTLTNKEGQAVYNFYTTDEPLEYTVTVMGVTAKGGLIYTQTKMNQQ
ncbi:MAG: hypothetical protein JWM28_1017 [Chitinophagaceae bacterium]|nr:hypothetical protein [Chitinophagaceae bacterium]